MRRDEKEVWSDIRREQRQCENATSQRAIEYQTGDLSCVQAAKRTAKDWISFQRELAQKGITVRKKFRRGTTGVEGLSYIKDGQKFKASQVDRDGRCSYAAICKALDRNKNREAKPQSPTTKSTPTPIEKAIQTGAEVAENISNALGGLFQVGPGYDPEEEAFIRQMKRRKKKKGRSL